MNIPRRSRLDPQHLMSSSETGMMAALGSFKHRRREFLAILLVFVGVLSLINLSHLLAHPLRARHSTHATEDSIPPDLIHFATKDQAAQNGKSKLEMTGLINQTEYRQEKKKKSESVRHDGFPPLDRLVNHDGDKITGKVDWLLDFAILGHAKCATTFVMNWLRQHEQVQMWDHEVCDLNNRQPASLVRKLYTELPAGDNYLRGFKCPGHFSREPLRYFRQYFKHTKLIVGLRHPVKWFESYYNFRIRHPRGGMRMPPPQRLLGPCVRESQGVCTDRANFHRNLAMLAKTNHSHPDEQALLVGMPAKYRQKMSPIPNPVFLYDVGQLYDSNPERKARFKADLEDFVGLDTPLPSDYAEPQSSKTDTKFAKLDICHSDFDEIRRELMAIASRSATWITQYFMQSESVVVSSPAYFTEILQSWYHDPCETTSL